MVKARTCAPLRPTPGDLLWSSLEYLPVGITVLDAELRLVLSNRRVRELLGWPERLTEPGTPLESIVRFNAERGDFGPGNPDALVAERMELAHRFEPHRIERELATGRVVEIHGNPLPDGGFVTIYTDITELRRAERQARDSEQRLRRILETSPVGIVVVSAHTGRLLFVNKRIAQLAGMRRKILNQKTLSDLIVQPNDLQELMTELDAQGCVTDYELEMRNLHGAPFWALVTIRQLSFEAESALYIWVYDISEQKRTSQRLARLASMDDLTGLANRRGLHDHLRRTLAHANRSSKPLAVLYLDLDGFKAVNDLSGHEAGDRVLRAVGARLKANLREEDMLARVGGDEFATVLVDIAEPAMAEKVAEKLIEALREPFATDAGAARIGASVGIAHHRGQSDTADVLLGRADRAMYRAKRAGKGRVVAYGTPEDEDEAGEPRRRSPGKGR